MIVMTTTDGGICCGIKVDQLSIKYFTYYFVKVVSFLSGSSTGGLPSLVRGVQQLLIRGSKLPTILATIGFS